MSEVSPDLDVYFAPIATCLQAFAVAHNLLIERYYHDAPLWSLCFTHPNGGHAKLDVIAQSQEAVTIESTWWLDEYNSFSRSIKKGGKKTVDKEARCIQEQLLSSLSEVLSWAVSDWDRIVTGYEPNWSQYSQAAFECMKPNWPEVKL